MSIELSKDFYHLALVSAKKRDLSRAVVLARHALCIAPEDEKASRLLEICLYELGDLGELNMERMREFVAKKKWRKAEAEARALKHQSVRVYNIRGCLYAASGRYRKAAVMFAKALEKDNGNETARRCLIEALNKH